MLNYRLAQFMPLLHDNELEEFVLALDPRITYRQRTTRKLFDRATYQPQISEITDTGNSLNIYGIPTTPDSSGRMRHLLDVLVGPTDITITTLAGWPGLAVTAYSLTDGLSNEILLGKTGYKFRIGNWDGANWLVETYIRPQKTIADLAATLRGMPGEHLLRLFGTSSEEPFETFRNLWTTHQDLPYAFGGLLLAVIHRTEDIRRARG